jgi:hypothetical protein
MNLFRLKRTPFDSWPRTPAGHFRLYFFAAISHLLQQLNEFYETPEKLVAAFPFLVGYGAELARDEPQRLDPPGRKKWWRETLSCCEAATADHLPLRAAREQNDLDHDAMILWLTIGMIEEDARFGLLFGTMQGASGAQRPTLGLLSSLFRERDGSDGRAKLKQLNDCGLIAFTGNELPKPEWKVELPAILWDLIRGEPVSSPAGWCRYRSAESLAPACRLDPSGGIARNDRSAQRTAGD